jgi:hypothetical protein
MTTSMIWSPPEKMQNITFGPTKETERFKNLMIDVKQCVSCGRTLREYEENINAEKEVMCKRCYEYYSKKYTSKW